MGLRLRDPLRASLRDPLRAPLRDPLRASRRDLERLGGNGFFQGSTGVQGLEVQEGCTWRGRGLSKWVISRVISTLHGVAPIKTLLLTNFTKSPAPSSRGLLLESPILGF